MGFQESKQYTKQAIIFLVIHTVFMATFAFDFFEIQ